GDRWLMERLRTAIQFLAFLRIALPILVFLGAAELSNDVGGTLGQGAPFREEVVTGIALLGCILFPFGTYFILDGIRGGLRAREAASWPVFSGKVLSNKIERTVTYGMVFYSPLVTYRYDVNGQQLESDAIEITNARFVSEQAARAVIDRYPVGATIAARVNP